MSRRLPLAVKIFDVLVALMCVAMLCVTSLPSTAYALNTVKCTARPNADTGSSVLGGVETRVTWEAQAAETESITQITLTMPEGTAYTLDNARLTLLSGADLMTRENPQVTYSAEGETIVVDFAEPTPAGRYFRLEVYGVNFPVAGGEMLLKGTYTLADGTTFEISDIPAIDVQVTSPAEQIARDLEQQEWVQDWNSNKFLRLFLNPPILVRSFPIVLGGFFMALAIVFVAFPLAIPFGLILSFMRMATSKTGRGVRELGAKLLRAIASIYVNVVRGTPVFLQIYIAFFGLPLAGIQIPKFILGVIVLAMNSAAYQCEIFRAGIQSINKGQFEASRSLGMNAAQTMLFVIIPQTVRRVLPTMTSEFILLYKDTSLLAAVGVMEIVMYAKTIVASTGSITPYIVAAFFYLVITIPLAKLVGILEARLSGNDGGSSKAEKKRPKNRKNVVADVDALAAQVEEPVALDDDEGDKKIAVSPERFASM